MRHILITTIAAVLLVVCVGRKSRLLHQKHNLLNQLRTAKRRMLNQQTQKQIVR